MKKEQCIRIKADVKQINSCKEIIKEFESSFDLISSSLSLAGNNVRLKILFLLSKERELCVCDLSDILSMKISAISQHLRKLKDRDIIKPKRKAQTIFYSLTEEYEVKFSFIFELVKNEKMV